MGASQSKEEGEDLGLRLPLEEFSSEEISNFVTNLGDKYRVYGDSIVENAVDGEFLLEMEDTDEFQETLRCLEVTNFIHQRVLTKEWKKAKTAAAAAASASPSGAGASGAPKGQQKQVKTTRSRTASPIPTTRTAGTMSATDPLLRRSATSFTVSTHTDLSELTLDMASQQSSPTSSYCKLIVDNNNNNNDHDDLLAPVRVPSMMPPPPPPPPHPVEEATVDTAALNNSSIPLSITVEHKSQLDRFGISKELPADDPVLHPYRKVANQILEELGGTMAQVNLLDSTVPAGVDRKGVNNLAHAMPGLPSPIRMHFDSPDEEQEICRRFVLASHQDFHVQEIPLEVSQAFGMKEPARYYGHVVKHGSLRIGTVCTVIQATPSATTSLAEKQQILQVLATLVEGHLMKRESLLQRKQNLQENLRHFHQHGGGDHTDPVLAPAYGPIPAVTASQVANRDILFPYPQEVGDSAQPTGRPTTHDPDHIYTRRSAMLPIFQSQKATTPEEQSHLSSTYFDDEIFSTTTSSASGAPDLDPTPISKRDMERVAVLESLGILQMSPTSHEAKVIESLVDLVGKILDAEWVFINFLDHSHCNFVQSTFPKKSGWPEMKHLVENTHELVTVDPQTNDIYLSRTERPRSLCNYTVATQHRQCFVVHDVAQDQSLAAYYGGAFRFYSGAPIVVRGVSIGALCCVCKDPNNQFSRIQEIQQEQFAQLVAQQCEGWALTKEVQRLERDRNLFLTATCSATTSSASSVVSSSSSSSSSNGSHHHSIIGDEQQLQVRSTSRRRANQPKDYAALVFTDIEGAGAMWEANSTAMNEATGIHNGILRSKIAAHCGYEVDMEGSSFPVAFADVVDAVNFCLRTQEALNQAPWGPDILACCGSTESGRDDADGAFCGLRVKMAIHCGDVESTRNQLSGRVAYTGDTFNIARGLVTMGHGGQILITTDVWNVASHLSESTLNSPQVLDLGAHVMPAHSLRMQDGVTTKNILQLVPASLAYDYHQSRQLGNTVQQRTTFGRLFPNLKSQKCVGASFHDAPFHNNTVSLVYVDTSEVEKIAVDAGLALAYLSKRISTILREQETGGYQCTDFLLAFPDSAAAVRCGLDLQEILEKEAMLDQPPRPPTRRVTGEFVQAPSNMGGSEHPSGELNNSSSHALSLRGKLKIGVHEGVFETMGPNPITGRADYSGKAVNRVALIATAAAAPGCVYLGKEAEDMDEFNLQPISNGFMLDFTGRQFFEGVQKEFSLYKCHPCKSWYDQMLDNRHGRGSLQSPWRRPYY